MPPSGETIEFVIFNLVNSLFLLSPRAYAEILWIEGMKFLVLGAETHCGEISASGLKGGIEGLQSP
jgi:hypothetical protein